MKRLILILTVCALLLISCAEKSNETVIKDSLPDDLNFGGAVLNFYTSGGGTGDFFAEEETGDILQDAIYKRNTTVEERLNIKINLINETEDTWGNTPVDKARASVMAGDNAYDVMIGHSVRWPILSLEGYLLNISTVPYLKLSEPWWSDNVIQQFTIGGNLNFIVGDIAKSFYSYTSAILVNKTLARKYDLPDMYEIVFDNKWTFDFLGEFVKNIYRDVDGNGVMDANDEYGFHFQFHNITTSAFDVFNAHMIKISSDGYPNLDPDYEKLVIITEKLYELAYNNPGVVHDIYRHEEYPVNEIFLDGRTMMIPSALGQGTSPGYRDFNDLGIIPYPKYDEYQDKYYSSALTSVSLMCVPIDCRKTDVVGAFMEAAASDGYKNIIPVFFDTVMKVKVARDEPTEKMIDIIRIGALISFEKIYSLSIGEPNYAILHVLGGRSSPNFATWYAANETKIITSLENLVEQMENLK